MTLAGRTDADETVKRCYSADWRGLALYITLNTPSAQSKVNECKHLFGQHSRTEEDALRDTIVSLALFGTIMLADQVHQHLRGR